MTAPLRHQWGSYAVEVDWPLDGGPAPHRVVGMFCDCGAIKDIDVEQPAPVVAHSHEVDAVCTILDALDAARADADRLAEALIGLSATRTFPCWCRAPMRFSDPHQDKCKAAFDAWRQHEDATR